MGHFGARSGSYAPEGQPGIGEPEIGQNGLAGNRGLSLRHQRRGALGQVDIDTRAETDQAEAFAGSEALPLADERDDAARDQARDLNHADAAMRRRDRERVALVVLARLVELGIDE